MGLITWIILGALAGWATATITKSNTGATWDIVLGVTGALVGGFMMTLFGQSGIVGFNVYSIIVAIMGAVIVVYVGRMLRSA
ncbi:MAG: GlsB/YeaQ/YmgE family stress response membrane protein [bacterium]|nr:GlsB/YeaQ/YmgE family stress response membrane protein [bacterium]